ncbi:putative sugar nucleotidyl transferase [Thermoproteota archaeon]
MINICIYEDTGYKTLYPLTTTRPAYDLLLGIDRLFDKFYRYFSYANITLHCRPVLKNNTRRLYPKISINKVNTGSPGLFINGRVVMTESLFNKLTNIDKEKSHLFMCQDQVVAVYAAGKLLDSMKKLLDAVPSSEDIIKAVRSKCVTKDLDNVTMVTWPWDLINANKECLKQDFWYVNQPGVVKADVKPFVVINNETNVFIEKGAVIEDFVYLDASKGPIYIEKNAYIQSGSRLEGPLFIGQGTKVLGGKITCSSIGKVCKVAGEVTDTVMMPFSNKAHSGFVGHSYIGEWVNLGAMTTTSNLKNTYGEVMLDYAGTKVASGQNFLGTIFGDHVKTGIGTTLNTGTIIGFGSNIFGTGLHAKYIPEFSWGSPDKYEEYKLEKFFATAARVMARRGQSLEKDDQEFLKVLYSSKAG